MDSYLKGIILDIKINDGTMYYLITNTSDEIFWFTSEELKAA